MASPVSAFTQIQIPEQQVFDGVPFPLVLGPAPASSGHQGETKNLAPLVMKNKPWLEERLKVAGALLFRGFDVHSPTAFNDVLEAFGYPETPVFATGASRTHIVGRVYTSNDGPPAKRLHFHNEMAYIENHPTRAFFNCQQEPENGGETPIVQGHVLYRKMAEKYPKFVEQVEGLGLVYIRMLTNGHDPKSMIGRGWQATFKTQDRTEAQNKAAELGWTLYWKEDGGVAARMAPVKGVKVVQGPDGQPRKVWFNSLAAAYVTWAEDRERGDDVKFADGTPLPTEVMEDYILMVDEESVTFQWKRGDVLLLDNLAVQHSRNSFVGARSVLAAFTV